MVEDINTIEWKNRVCYSTQSPTFLVWIVDRKAGKGCLRRLAGQTAGSLGSENKYPTIKANNKSFAIHKVVWILHFGQIPTGYIVDHTDGDIKNNAIENLSLKTHKENNRNTKKRKDNRTGYCGITYKFNKASGIGYYVASWKDEDGKQRSKNISINKHGDEQALALAIKAREQAILSLQELGIFYTSRHGL